MSQFVKFVQGIYQNPTQFTVTDVSGDIKDIKPNFGNEIQKGTPYTASLFNEITRQISYTVKDLGTGGANSYIVQLDGLAQGDLKDNLKVILVPQANNTGACTITFNGLGINPVSIKKGNQDLKDADIIANQHAILNYNETNSSFELLNPQSGAEKVDIVQQQVDDLKDVVYTKPSTQMILEAEETKSADIEVSGLINPKYEGAFRQNLIDTHKCIYRMSGDSSSSIPVDITDNSMKIMANSSSYVGTGCFVGVTAGKEYTVKATSVDDTVIQVSDADGLTFSNRATKLITDSQKKTNHNFKFIAPSSNYIFITFSKHGSDTTGTVVTNSILIEGDYVGKDIEWVKGAQPSIPSVNISGTNLFDGNWVTETNGFNIYKNTLKEFSFSVLGVDSKKVNLLPNVKFKPNTQYTFNGKAFRDSSGASTSNTLFVGYTDGTVDDMFIPQLAETNFNFVSDSNKTINRISSYSGSAVGVTTVKDFMIVEGTTAPTEYIPPKQSQFKLNDWLGDNEVYENGLVTKQWGRVLLSEAWDGTFYNASSDLGSVYRFYLNLKRNYSEHSIDTVAYSYFKDFTFKSDHESDFKHQYLISRTSVNKNRFLIFIPKQEIDNLTGSTLEEKFKEWIKENDDYIYYKKSSSATIEANGSSLGGTFGNELNTFSNGSFGKVTFDYQNSVIDSLTALSNSVNSLNTDQIVQDYTQKISDKIVVLKDRTIKQTDWVFDNFNGRYYLEFKNELISPNKVVDVNFDISSYSNARVVLGITSSDYGKVTLYARTQPTVDLVADIIIKEVN